MATTGGDVSFRFVADTSGLTAAVKDVARAQESAAATAATASAAARTALEAQRAATVSVTMAEKELIAKTLALEAATRSKAAALGISVGQLRQVEAATQRASAASTTAAGSVSSLGNAAAAASGGLGKTVAAVGGLGSVVALVSPQAGQLVSALGPLSGAVTKLGGSVVGYAPIIAGLAPIFATVGAAALVYTAVMGDYTAAKREATRVTEQFAATMLPLNEAIAAAKSENELLTQAQAAGKEELKEFLALSEIQSGVAAKEAAATATLRAELDTLTQAYAANAQQTRFAGQIQSNRIGKLNEEIGAAGAAARKLNELGVANLYLRDALEHRAGGEEKAAKATKASTAVVEENGDAYARATDGVLKDMARQDAARMASGEKQLAAFRIQENASQAARDQVIADADQKIEAEKEWTRVLKVVADQNIAYAVGIGQSAADVLGAIGGVFDRMASGAADAYDQASGRAENLRGLIDGLSTATVDAADLSGDALVAAYRRGEVATEDLSDAQRKAIEDELSAREQSAEARAKVEKKAAKEAFETSKAVAIAQAVVAGAVAIVQGFAQLGPLGGAIAAVGIVATTAAEIALIDSTKPAFHAGGMYPDEGNARLLGGEPVLNRQAAARLGLDTPGAVSDLNQGGAGAQLGGMTVLRIGRLEAREIVRSDIAAGGLIVRTARAAAKSAGNPAGRTGRRPIA